MTPATCSHLLAKNGICRCGWRAHVPEPEAPAKRQPRELDGDEMKAERARRRFYWFFREAWHVLEPSTPLEVGWHIEAICDHLQWLYEDWKASKRNKKHKQKTHDAYFSLPPGCLKTRIVSEMFNAWVWLDEPTWTVICLSRNPARARDSARNTRQVITSDWYTSWFTPSWEIREDQDALGDFGNTVGGWRKSRGILAEIVGTRADAMLVDDPQAPDDGEEQLEKINSLWDSTLYSRVNDLRISMHVIVQQRLATNDLTGHVTKTSGWMGFVLPLLFDPDRICKTLYGWVDPRKVLNQPLHPERFTEEVIRKLRYDVLGPSMFEAQAQQDPDKVDGQHFKSSWWNFARLDTQKEVDPTTRGTDYRQDAPLVLTVDRWGMMDVDSVCVTVDATGGSTEDDASHVGLLVCATKGEKRIVLDDLGQGPRNWPEMVADLSVAIPHAANMTGKHKVHLLIEKKALGPALSKEIEGRVKGEGFTAKDGGRIAVTIEDYEPSNSQASKIARAQAMEVPMALGEVYVMEGAPWLQKFFAEFRRFPKKPNDRVDALAQFIDNNRKRLTWKDAMRKHA